MGRQEIAKRDGVRKHGDVVREVVKVAEKVVWSVKEKVVVSDADGRLH